MVSLLLLLGFMAVAAGVFGVGLGIPTSETLFGVALIMAGSVAITGGLILVGLAAAVRELQRVVQGFKAPQSGMPRPVRPLERRDEERIENSDRRTEPRLYMPATLGADSPDVIPAKFDAPETRERWRKPASDEWLRRALAEIDSTSRRADPAPPPIDYQPRDMRLDCRAGDMRRPSNSWSRPAIPLAPDRAETELRRTPGDAEMLRAHAEAEMLRAHAETEMRRAHAETEMLRAHAAETEIRRTSALSSQDMQDLFETIWASEPRTSDEGPEPRAEPSLVETGMRTGEAKSPPLAPAQPPASIRSLRAESRPLPILKSGVIHQMAYTLFTDGSIEAQMPEGNIRFASIEELRRHLEANEG